ncbi:hypothetical protein V8B97DRAFT_1988970 [Scleroderma yunnanense]
MKVPHHPPPDAYETLEFRSKHFLCQHSESTNILNAAEEHLMSTYLFILPDRDAVAIMDGGRTKMCMRGSQSTISST